MKTSTQKILGFLGLALFFLAFWQVNAATAGLDIIKTKNQDLPIEIFTPADASDGSRPIVLIGHGFAGSGVIMRGFAVTFAKAGYVTALWDFDGHGSNPRPLPAGMLRGDLLPNAEQALEAVTRLGIGDPTRLAILGHSMGSGVALTFGQKHPETMATIAVSPVDVSVTPLLPRNLLLMAGSNEAAFLHNAEQLLAEAGGPGGQHSDGTARQLSVVPGVEHLTIVLSPTSFQIAREWLDATFGKQPGALDYRDQRLIWYGIGALGAILAALFLVPPTKPVAPDKKRPFWIQLGAIAAGGIGATLLLWLVSQAGISLSGTFGLLVGGYLMIWFAVAGVIATLLLSLPRRAEWLDWPGAKVLISGFLVATALWAGIGLLGGQIWLPWLLIPARLILWPVAIACLLPWFLAVGITGSPVRTWGRLGWWLANTLIIVGSLLLAMRLMPGLSFLVLILPVFPLILGAHALAAGRQRHVWAFTISAVLFISWALMAVFPLSM